MGKDTGKKYHEKATGAALETAEQHSKPADTGIVLFGSCFCPFVQRVWVCVYHGYATGSGRRALLTLYKGRV
jgi:glutathione S-transferase